MIDIQQENTTARRKEVGEWLKLASENARSAVLLAEAGGLERQALYMAQQSMETTAKGLARRVGMSYEDIKVERHNLLHLYAKTLDLVVSGTGIASRLDKLLSRLSVQGEAYNTLDKLQHMIALTASPRDEKTPRDNCERILWGDDVRVTRGRQNAVDGIGKDVRHSCYCD